MLVSAATQGPRYNRLTPDGVKMDDERETVLFTVSGEVIAAARKKILACEHCSDDAQVPFNVLLDEIMLFSGAHTDYILTECVHCPWCGKEITEETLVEWE